MYSVLHKISRLYSSVATSQLALLRKNTGFPLSKCREALSKNGEELEEAERWLYKHAQAEGWAKVEKLKSRPARQGLVGLLIRDDKAAMLEVRPRLCLTQLFWCPVFNTCLCGPDVRERNIW